MTSANPTAPPAPYLVALKIARKKVVVVGGGEIGTGKIETLLAARPRLVVIDPSPSDRVRDLASRNKLELRERRFCPLDLFGSRMVVAATGDSRTNRRIRLWARLTRALVNAVDDPPNCDVTVPAVVRRGPATIAISTGGATPAGARYLREQLSVAIDNVLPLETGEVLDAARHARQQLRQHGGYRFDYHGWRDAFFEPAFNAMRTGQAASLPMISSRFIRSERSRTGPTGPGLVTLVGAGPSGDDLITIRGARALARAEVVVYDRLADPALLSYAPAAAERIPVGKGKGFGHTQCSINALLIARSKRGQRVVRLKGGDPFVFGRGGEEVAALDQASIPFEIVPGVSSALAAPALAGIAVTDRRFASSFTVVTGHDALLRCESNDGLVQGTLVVLMAATTAAAVAQRLIQAGRRPNESVAFVHRAGAPNQATHGCALADVVLEGQPFSSPVVMIVGDVVGPWLAPKRTEQTASVPSVVGLRTWSH